MALKTWPQLANNELVAHAEVRDAVSRGELQWIAGEPALPPDGTGLDPDKRCYTRAMYEQYIRHVSMGGSGIGMNEPMSKLEMIQYRQLSDPVPLNFEAVHDMGACPAIVVDLYWSNAGVLEPTIIEWRDSPLSDWMPLTSPPAGVTHYTHIAGFGGSFDYRIRFLGYDEWAYAGTPAMC